jgi:hypothetical protein
MPQYISVNQLQTMIKTKKKSFMRKAIKIAATFAIIAFGMTSCQKENTENAIKPTDSTQNKVEAQDTSTVNQNNAVLVATENVPQSVRDGFTTSETEQVFAKNFSTQNKTLAVGRRVTVYGDLYCESKGGDDGYGLEIFGNVSVNMTNTGGYVIAPPIVGSSIFKNGYPLIFIRPGQTKSVNYATYRVPSPATTLLKLAAHLKDDDRNSDDGKWINPADDMGNTYRYISIPNPGVSVQYMRYANGGQIVWMKYTIYVN